MTESHRDEMERACLGAMLKEPARIAEVRGVLAWQDFYSDAHQQAARAIFDLADAGATIDALSVGEKLIARGWQAQSAGEPFAFGQALTDACPSPASAARYAQSVKEAARRRALEQTLGRLAELAQDRRMPLEHLEAEFRRATEGAAPPAAGAADADEQPLITRMSDVVAERISYLWQGWLPDGCLCVLDGDPGLGKSSLTLDLAARLSRGDALPPLESQGADLGRRPCSTLLLGAEDPLEYVVRPRLDAMGADVSRIHALEGFVAKSGRERLVLLPGDLDRVASFIESNEVKLVVVDPLMAFLSSDTDAHKDQDVRRVLRPLSLLARKLRVVVLLVRHLNKLSGGPALYRGGSSIGITGAARASLICGRDPMEDRFVLAMNKINVGPRPPSLAYKVEGAGLACRIVWQGECDLRPDQILGHGTQAPGGKGAAKGRPADALEESRCFLADLLCGGPVPAKDVEEAADRAGLAWRTVAKAKSEMGIQSKRRNDVWYWQYPEGKDATNPLCPPWEGPDQFGDSGTLGENPGKTDDADDSPWAER